MIARMAKFSNQSEFFVEFGIIFFFFLLQRLILRLSQYLLTSLINIFIQIILKFIFLKFEIQDHLRLHRNVESNCLICLLPFSFLLKSTC